MIFEVSHRLAVREPPPAFAAHLRRVLTSENPEWLEVKRLGRFLGDTPRWLTYYSEEQESGRVTALYAPRGFTPTAQEMARANRVPYQVVDLTVERPEADLTFRGTLHDFQTAAVAAMLGHRFGVLQAPTGSGKTVIGLALAAARRQPTLVVVHTVELLDQWVERIEEFLGVPRKEVGRMGAGRRKVGERITVALFQTLRRHTEEVAEAIGHVIVDECHRCPSTAFSEAVFPLGARYLTGLSATPYRRDGLTHVIGFYVGPTRHAIAKVPLLARGHLACAEVVVRPTAYEVPAAIDQSQDYSRMLADLVRSQPRNDLIARDVAAEDARGRGPILVLTDRVIHAALLVQALAGHGVEAELVVGASGKRQRRAAVQRVRDGEATVLVATGQLIGEGFDLAQLSALFVATPIKFSGRLLQYLGRVLRPAGGKSIARVYDYADERVGVLAASARARQRTYAAEAGVHLCEGGAVP